MIPLAISYLVIGLMFFTYVNIILVFVIGLAGGWIVDKVFGKNESFKADLLENKWVSSNDQFWAPVYDLLFGEANIKT
jgi:hypothetical protein